MELLAKQIIVLCELLDEYLILGIHGQNNTFQIYLHVLKHRCISIASLVHVDLCSLLKIHNMYIEFLS